VVVSAFVVGGGTAEVVTDCDDDRSTVTAGGGDESNVRVIVEPIVLVMCMTVVEVEVLELLDSLKIMVVKLLFVVQLVVNCGEIVLKLAKTGVSIVILCVAVE